MALLLWVEFAIALGFSLLLLGIEFRDPMRFVNLLIALGALGIAWDAVPRGEVERRLREVPESWEAYLTRYD